MDQVSEIVARLYTEWSYPEPIADMAAAISSGYLQQGDPRFFAPLYWPERRNLAGTKILIAGCGTNQAAYYAMRLPETSVTAIDLSLPSLQHTQFLKERHGLDNLNLRQMNLLDVARLDSGPYDLIVSTGVLHHLPDPDVGLRALRDVLAPDGVMNLMVYGRYLRVGVYMLQEAFRRLGCSHSLDDVALVRATLQVLPPHHSVHG
jgi:SAM-dependent methyltransferase